MVFLQGDSKSDVYSGFCKNKLSRHLARIALIKPRIVLLKIMIIGGFTFQFLQCLFLDRRKADAEIGGQWREIV